MRAIIHDRYGPADLLRLGELPRPIPGPGEVLVAVRAASVHADVWHTVLGVPYALRLMGNGLRKPNTPVPGTDVAGEVVALGPGATRFRPGDPVFGEVVQGNQWRNGGTFAEFVCAPESALELKPDALDFVAAAAVPTSGLIALRAVRREGRVAAGDRVLINGAAGGVGMFAAQIASARGAHVTGVDAGDRLDLLAEIGVDEAIDYTAEDFTTGSSRYDVIIDIPGNHPFSRIRRVLVDDGRYVWIGHDRYDPTGRRWLGGIPAAFALLARSAWTPQLPRPDFSGNEPDSMPVLTGLAAQGKLRPIIDRTFPLAEAAAAITYLQSGQARGRVVLTVASPETTETLGAAEQDQATPPPHSSEG